MQTPRPHFWPRSALIRFAVLALVGVAGLGGGEAVAGPTGAASEGHLDRCKCGRGCRGPACCCSGGGRADRPEAPPAATEARHAARVLAVLEGDNPCLRAGSCGDPYRPGSTGGGVGRAALMTPGCRICAATGRRHGLRPARPEWPAARADRLDEPPEAA